MTRRLRVLTLRQGHAQRSSSGLDTVRNEPGQSVCRSASWGELTLDDVARGRSAFALVVVAGCLSPRATRREMAPPKFVLVERKGRKVIAWA